MATVEKVYPEFFLASDDALTENNKITSELCLPNGTPASYRNTGYVDNS